MRCSDCDALHFLTGVPESVKEMSDDRIHLPATMHEIARPQCFGRLNSPCASRRSRCAAAISAMCSVRSRSTYRVGQKPHKQPFQITLGNTQSQHLSQGNNGRKRWKRWWFARIPRSGRLRRTLRLLSPSGHFKRTCHKSRIPFPFRSVGLQSMLLRQWLFLNMDLLACMLRH